MFVVAASRANDKRPHHEKQDDMEATEPVADAGRFLRCDDDRQADPEDGGRSAGGQTAMTPATHGLPAAGDASPRPECRPR